MVSRDENIHSGTKVPPWRNRLFLKWLAQVVVLVAVVGLFVILGSQAAKNWSTSGITFGWDWLAEPFGVALSEGIDTLPDSGARALLVGAINTLRIALSAILASTVLGTIVGVARLSNNWVVSKAAVWFVESVRNIPLLLQIFFWQAVTFSLPVLTESDIGTHWLKVSNRGFGLSWIRWDGGFWPWLVFVAVGLVVARIVARRQTHARRETGNPGHPVAAWVPTVALFAFVGWFAWPVLSFVSPVMYTIADFAASLPAVLFSLLVAIVALGVSARWIWRFFAARRGPGGFSRLTDDDWFRVGFVALASVGVAAGAFVVGSSEILTTSGETMSLAQLSQTGIGNFFRWIGNNFSPDGNQPLIAQKVSVVQSGNFVQFGDTGLVMRIPFFAVFVAITLYSSAFIAEIVRGGIQAIPRTQTDAAKSVGLSRSQYMRTVVLPQAYRIILPPIGNQYINVLKNSSLGVATALPDIMTIGITIVNQTGEFRAVVLVWILFFLGISLAISAVVNVYNRRMNLVEF